jgi:hypothetical protein
MQKLREMKRSNKSATLFTAVFILLIVWVLTFLSSCHEPEIVKIPVPEQDTPEVIDNPDTLVHHPDTVVVNPNPEVDPDLNKKTMKVTWSDLDYRLYTFNEKNQLEKYHFQYVFVQNDPTQIKSFDYTFNYDEEGKLKESLYNNRFKTIFEYANGVLSGAKEYNGYDEISAEYQYTLNAEGRPVEVVLKSFVTGYRQVKYNYKYSQGNLIEMKESYFEGDRYVPSLAMEWSDFDNHPFVENYTAFSPYVPTLTFWNNNPGKRTVKDKNGNITGAIENYSYTYDNNGNVVSKSKQVVMDNKVYPATTQYYSYK